MGDPKFPRRQYLTPSHPWKTDRIQEENALIRKFGLKNKREVWKSKAMLGRLRGQARKLVARMRTGDLQAEKEKDLLLKRLTRMGLLKDASTLDDILSLTTEALLARRFQTIVYLKGMAHSPKQARQFIVHGHTAIGGRKVTVPGYLVLKTEEETIEFRGASALSSDVHPERPGSKEHRAERSDDVPSPVKKTIKLETGEDAEGVSEKREEGAEGARNAQAIAEPSEDTDKSPRPKQEGEKEGERPKPKEDKKGDKAEKKVVGDQKDKKDKKE